MAANRNAARITGRQARSSWRPVTMPARFKPNKNTGRTKAMPKTRNIRSTNDM